LPMPSYGIFGVKRKAPPPKDYLADYVQRRPFQN
jgi:hypothetical protein